VDCTSCGKANPDGNQFCTGCGAPMTAAAPPPVAPTPVAPTYAPPPSAAAPGYAPAPAYAPPVAYAAPQAPAPKKKRGCIIAVAIVAFLLLCCCGSIAAAYFGLANLNKPRDLGVKYTQKDYSSATKKLGVDVSKADPAGVTAGEDTTVAGEDAAATGDESTGGEVTPPDKGSASAGGSSGGGTTGGGTKGGTTSGGTAGGTNKPAGGTQGTRSTGQAAAAGTVVIYEGSVPVDIDLTNEEFSALISLNHYSPNWLVKDMQVKFGDGNTMEMSGYVEFEGQRYPVYVSGTAQLTGPKTFGGTATAVSVGGFEVPADYYPMAAEFLAGLLNDWLAQMEGLNLESVEISGGIVHIKGTVPATVIRVPAGTGQ
jgi:hypothetical protein